MIRWMLVLGCYGFVVSPASAGGQWSAETCRHLQEVKVQIKSQDVDNYFKSVQVFPVLLHQRAYCGSSVRGEIEATAEIIIIKAGGPANVTVETKSRDSSPSPPQPPPAHVLRHNANGL
jgi:hypothetical protein